MQSKPGTNRKNRDKYVPKLEHDCNRVNYIINTAFSELC